MSSPRRPYCQRCQRPCTACICAWITAVAGEAALLVLQHPLEVANAKGSARLLHLSLRGSQVVVGESFDQAMLHDLLVEGGRQPVLLYPTLPGEAALGIPAAPELSDEWTGQAERIRLVVLDATWRKSRKMLYLNHALHDLPRLSLTGLEPSRYRIRKAHTADQMSTLEATCHALGRIERQPKRYEPLLQSFDAFTAHFAATGGRVGERARYAGRLENDGEGA